VLIKRHSTDDCDITTFDRDPYQLTRLGVPDNITIPESIERLIG